MYVGQYGVDVGTIDVVIFEVVTGLTGDEALLDKELV